MFGYENKMVMKASRGLLIGLSILASGCATKEPETTYWTQKSGVVVVHHVQDGVDHIEKLSEQKLTDGDVQAQNLPKGKYFKVVETEQHVAPPAKHAESDAPKTMRQGIDGAKLAEVSQQIRELKSKISEVVAENQRLQGEIRNRPAESANPGLQNNQAVQTGESAQSGQVGQADAPRLSQ
jgi:hypothetical protein